MRQSDRWIWRAFGALAVSVVVYQTYPRAPQPAISPVSELRLASLRIAEPIQLPDLKLWGAGPPMDLQWQVVALPVTEAMTPEVPVIQAPKSQRQSKRATRRIAPAKVAAVVPKDWRYEFVYERVSG